MISIDFDKVLSANKSDSGINIYITFDDGLYSTTPKLTKFLSAHSIKLSFFIVGSQLNFNRFHDSVFNDVK
jgi:peptidoglycan/xylan/chitin deacetylase (PgdA/CDA1 family)